MKKQEIVQKLRAGMELPELIANGILLICSGFMLALIVCLFLFQPKQGERLEATIYEFKDNSSQYYDENESYRQVYDNINTYKSSGRPD